MSAPCWLDVWCLLQSASFFGARTAIYAIYLQYTSLAAIASFSWNHTSIQEWFEWCFSMFACVFSRLICVHAETWLAQQVDIAQQTLASEDEIARSYLEGASLDEVFAQIDDAEASAVKKTAYKKPGLHVEHLERSKACRFLDDAVSNLIFTGRSARSGQWRWNGLERKAVPRKSVAAYQEGKLAEEIAHLLREDSQPFKKDWIHSCTDFVWLGWCHFIDFIHHNFMLQGARCGRELFHVPCVCSSLVPKVTWHRRTPRCNSPWLVSSSQGPVICLSPSRFGNIATCTW